MKKYLLVFASLLLVAGCSKPKPVPHDINRAVKDANETLYILYIKKDIHAAYEKFDNWFKLNYSEESLRRMAEKFEQESSYQTVKRETTKEIISTDVWVRAFGPLKSIACDSYAAFANRSPVTLYYTAEHKYGMSYQTVVVDGNPEKGYKILSIYVQPQPFKPMKERVPFERPIEVQSNRQ